MFSALIAALSSGSGKTAVTCGLLAVMKRRGMNPCAFKCGPDYIDPMFHRRVLGADSRNLDLFLSDEPALHATFARGCMGHDSAICEGVMGYYDGVGGTTTQASAYHVADTLHLPVILVLRPRGSCLTLAAQVKGLLQFRSPSHIAGILLNDCAPMLFSTLAPMLQGETGLPVLGYLPHMEEASFESRHLGLLTADEIGNLGEKIAAIAAQMEQTVDLDALFALCQRPAPPIPPMLSAPAGAKIGVARDEAFSFCYPHTLEMLEQAGGQLVFFSPLHDDCLPQGISGLYLPGGYPELHAQGLSENTPMRHEIAQAVSSGLPTVAECGGFLYLGKALEGADGVTYPMAGVLPGHGFSTKKLVRFGYAHLQSEGASLLFSPGQSVPVHEFHYWDTTENGNCFGVRKPSGRSWRGGFSSPTLYAAFPHLYFSQEMAERFLSAAETFYN